MRLAGLIVIAALGACSTTSGGGGGLGPSPFPVERGSALAPPAAAAGTQSAPPEGAAPGGIDFGQWRNADPAVYAPAFQSQIRARAANLSATELRGDLERNGFACEEGARLECRIEIMERQCAIDWYVVVERGAPVAGFDRMCLGAR
jgi:hypothetical protein